MMAERKRRPGRPRTRPSEETPGDYVGFRAPRKLKEQLTAAAAKAGRSLSTETQVRLEHTFRDEDRLGGPDTFHVTIRMLAAFLSGGQMAARIEGRKWSVEQWMNDPNCYEQALTAVIQALWDAHPSPDDERLKWWLQSLQGRMVTRRINTSRRKGGAS